MYIMCGRVLVFIDLMQLMLCCIVGKQTRHAIDHQHKLAGFVLQLHADMSDRMAEHRGVDIKRRLAYFTLVGDKTFLVWLRSLQESSNLTF